MFDGVIGRRIWGWVIDAVILALLLGMMHLVLLIFGLITFGLGWYLLGGLWIVPAAYSFLWIASEAQATPGQMLTRLRVVRNEDFGRPSAAQALVYAAGFWLTMAAGVVLVLTALVTERKRCLHDVVSGLVVVRTEALTAASSTWNMRGGRFAR